MTGVMCYVTVDVDSVHDEIYPEVCNAFLLLLQLGEELAHLDRLLRDSQANIVMCRGCTWCSKHAGKLCRPHITGSPSKGIKKSVW